MRVTEADIKAWEKYGPAIFHGDMTGPEVLARVRIAALEEAARYVEGHGGVIPGAVVFAPLVSGNNQPCMSGDPRDRLSHHVRRRFDDAVSALATAIRNLTGEE